VNLLGSAVAARQGQKRARGARERCAKFGSAEPRWQLLVKAISQNTAAVVPLAQERGMSAFDEADAVRDALLVTVVACYDMACRSESVLFAAAAAFVVSSSSLSA
jgi:hypothetical protein